MFCVGVSVQSGVACHSGRYSVPSEAVFLQHFYVRYPFLQLRQWIINYSLPKNQSLSDNPPVTPLSYLKVGMEPGVVHSDA